MITRLKIENFKSLRDVEIRPGRVNIFFGPNGSGKSNLFDALRVLKGFGLGMTVDQVFNQPSTQPAFGLWPGIRGGSGQALFRGKAGAGSNDCTFAAEFSDGQGGYHLHEMRITPDRGLIPFQKVRSSGGSGPSIESYLDDRLRQQVFVSWEKAPRTYERPIIFPDRSILASQLPEGIQEVARVLIGHFERLRLLDLVPFIIAERSPSQGETHLGPRGENLASTMMEIFDKTNHKESMLAWLRELVEEPIEDLSPKLLEDGAVYLRMRQFGQEFIGNSLSDGTLRFIALVAAFFQITPPQVLAIEEIENGIHPSRLRVVMELIRSQSERTGTQVFATTHSPVFLAWLDEDMYDSTYLCHRDEASGETKLIPVSQVPHFMELAKDKRAIIADLFSEGWFEMAL